MNEIKPLHIDKIKLEPKPYEARFSKTVGIRHLKKYQKLFLKDTFLTNKIIEEDEQSLRPENLLSAIEREDINSMGTFDLEERSEVPIPINQINDQQIFSQSHHQKNVQELREIFK